MIRRITLFSLALAANAFAQGKVPDPSSTNPFAPPTTKPAAPKALAPTLDDQLKGALTPLLVKQKVPALAVALFNREEIVARAASGLRARGEPDSVTTADRWHIGSCTKAFTSSVIGALVDQGKLDWETTLAEALPDAAQQMHADLKKVTLRQLLRHRAGLAAFTAGNSPDFEMLKGLPGAGVREQRAAFVAKLLSLEPVMPPDTKQFYSNASFTVAAAIAERVADKPYETLLQDHIFGKLALTHAGLGWPANPTRRDEPRGHLPGILGVRPQDFDPDYKLDPVLAPAGDIHCTIEELAAFAQAHLDALLENEKASPAGTRSRPLFLKPHTIAELHDPVDGYAAGWAINTIKGKQRHWHNGSAGTFFALMVIIPERKIGAVAMTNSGDGEKACVEIIETALGLAE
ncbi:MAG: serine hydrolase domain-containing protein [Phycisphaerales bacterium]